MSRRCALAGEDDDCSIHLPLPMAAVMTSILRSAVSLSPCRACNCCCMSLTASSASRKERSASSALRSLRARSRRASATMVLAWSKSAALTSSKSFSMAACALSACPRLAASSVAFSMSRVSSEVTCDFSTKRPVFSADRCWERSNSSWDTLTEEERSEEDVTWRSSSRSETRSYDLTNLLFSSVTCETRSCT